VKLYDDQLIVITGAAGFIGSGVVRYLNDKGMDNLLLVDDLGKSDKWKNLRGKRFVDLISIQELFTFLEGKERAIEAFIHLGACTDTVEMDGDYLMNINTRYTMRLADYALKAGHRFIYASSAATYGMGELGFSDDVDLIDRLQPLNPYGYSKHLFDLWVQRQGLLDRVVGLKYFNVFGPNEGHKGRMASMIHKMFPLVQKDGVVKLFKSSDPSKFGDGEQCRDFIYVKDAVKITCSFLENDVCGIFNVGYGQATTWNTVAKALFKALRKAPNIQYVDMPHDLIAQYQNYTCAQLKNLTQTCGAPIFDYSVEEAVIDYVQNYLLTDARW
jgi:ADP-L-glycero-D-manno-heptose 6-epimerase